MRRTGAAAGIEAGELAAQTLVEPSVRVTCIDYSPDEVLVQEVRDLDDFLARHRPEWSKVRWINIDGLGQAGVIRGFAEKYQLHPLAVEDVLHTIQRPKAEDYPGSEESPGRLFIIARTVEFRQDRLHDEQVSIFLGRTTLLTFQENPGSLFNGVRTRIQTAGSRIRQNDVSFLFYSLLDAIVDSYFPILDIYSERLEDLEEELLGRPSGEMLQKIHRMRRDLVLLRRTAWPMRELVSNLQRERHECLSETTATFFRDLYDHCVQVMDLVETYHEISVALLETYMSVSANRMNEIMKVLTIIGTIFIPLTFVAGVYGMNMPIPENRWAISYPLFWLVSVALAGGMLVWFRRRGWIG